MYDLKGPQSVLDEVAFNINGNVMTTREIMSTVGRLLTYAIVPLQCLLP